MKWPEKTGSGRRVLEGVARAAASKIDTSVLESKLGTLTDEVIGLREDILAASVRTKTLLLLLAALNVTTLVLVLY